MADVPANLLRRPPLAGLEFGGIPETVGGWLRRKRYRTELRRLLRTAPHMIADIGLTPGDARFEIDKPFWHE